LSTASFERISVLHGRTRDMNSGEHTNTWTVVLRIMTGLLHAQLLAEILRIRDDDFRVLFSDGRSLSTLELNCILSCVSSSRSYNCS